mmetsp:Transcript_23791/g.54828  ORF Transcript_23791/g.54828 Transcript_23791/m.54828 type:complete len:237 (+) Transcript_23791:143-853(+)
MEYLVGRLHRAGHRGLLPGALHVEEGDAVARVHAVVHLAEAAWLSVGGHGRNRNRFGGGDGRDRNKALGLRDEALLVLVVLLRRGRDVAVLGARARARLVRLVLVAEAEADGVGRIAELGVESGRRALRRLHVVPLADREPLRDERVGLGGPGRLGRGRRRGVGDLSLGAAALLAGRLGLGLGAHLGDAAPRHELHLVEGRVRALVEGLKGARRRHGGEAEDEVERLERNGGSHGA